ncbi:MAG: HlyD family type I secretion periplasmic adaptor subunit [Steroidobacteraceae bacterium]
MFLRTAPANEHIILYVLAAMLVLAVGLAAIVKLDRVVTSAGRIVPTGGELYVSPFDTGIVRQVNVKAGDIVKKGQVLATLDPTFTHANLLQLQQKLASDEAAVARLEAELSGRPYAFSATDPDQSLQGEIWQKRQAEYRENLADFDGRIHGAESQVAQAQSDAQEYAKRLKLADEVEKTYQPLLDKGYVSKLQLMQATDERTEMGRLLAVAQNQISSLRQTLASQKAQRESYIQKWNSDTGTALVTVRNDLDVTRQNLEKAQKLSDLSSLDAPADAVVLKVGKVSSGSVASSGGQNLGQEPLFTLVPLDAPLEADVKVSAADIGFIKIGDPVQLKLDAYRFMQHGTAKGVIKTISEGSFTTDENNVPVTPYFKVRVAIKEAHLRNVPPDFRLIPGMTLAGDIMVGRRTILSYLVEGGLRTGSEAMREP